MKSKKEFHRYTGDLSQILGIKEYELTSGRAKGVRAYDVKNGSGLEYTLLGDRCLDISSLSIHGVNCGYLSKTGISAPCYSESGMNFSRSFYAGFLTTCGLRNVGNACEDNGELFGLHGRVSNLPAEEVNVSVDWVDNLPELTVSGKIREASFFGENLLLERHVSCRYGENSIYISNVVENQGFETEVLMLLLHFNIGYPLLSPSARFISSSERVVPRDNVAEEGIADYTRVQPPTANYKEQVFYHTLRGDKNQATSVALINPELELGVSLHFNMEEFPLFGQWKQMGEGEYVMGMEPSNCYVGGRLDPRNKGILVHIQPFEKKRFDVKVEVHVGLDSLGRIEDSIGRL